MLWTVMKKRRMRMCRRVMARMTTMEEREWRFCSERETIVLLYQHLPDLRKKSATLLLLPRAFNLRDIHWQQQ
ncbi:hypothetical protein M9458_024866, partial [Cirrhinus mrigala]